MAKMIVWSSPPIQLPLRKGQVVRTRLTKKKIIDIEHAFVLDTCYLIRLARSEAGIYNTLKRLSRHGDIIVTEQVVDEFKKNVKSKRDAEKEDVGELYRAINEGIVMKENVDVSKEKHEELSKSMGELSEVNNRRLGPGDASIVVITDMLKGLYDFITALSTDSDLHVLIPAKKGVSVREAY